MQNNLPHDSTAKSHRQLQACFSNKNVIQCPMPAHWASKLKKGAMLGQEGYNLDYLWP